MEAIQKPVESHLFEETEVNFLTKKFKKFYGIRVDLFFFIPFSMFLALFLMGLWMFWTRDEGEYIIYSVLFVANFILVVKHFTTYYFVTSQYCFAFINGLEKKFLEEKDTALNGFMDYLNEEKTKLKNIYTYHLTNRLIFLQSDYNIFKMKRMRSIVESFDYSQFVSFYFIHSRHSRIMKIRKGCFVLLVIANFALFFLNLEYFQWIMALNVAYLLLVKKILKVSGLKKNELETIMKENGIVDEASLRAWLKGMPENQTRGELFTILNSFG